MGTETGTFSALVDDVRVRSGRVDRTADIISYARTSMRECTVLSMFDQNLVEGVAVADAIPFIFKRPVNFRVWVAIKYPALNRQGGLVFAKERPPGKLQDTFDVNWFYRSGDSFIFNGLEIGAKITFAYQAYLPKLAYYTAANRPATYDLETELWTYLPEYMGNDALNQAGQDKVTNWMLFNWYDLIMEGTLAKLYKTVADERQKSSYALYKQQQQDLIKGESSNIFYQGDIE